MIEQICSGHCHYIMSTFTFATMILSFMVKIITDILISTYGFFDSVL